MHGSECAVGIRKIVSDGLEARHTIGLAVLEGAAVLEPRWRRLIIGLGGTARAAISDRAARQRQATTAKARADQYGSTARQPRNRPARRARSGQSAKLLIYLESDVPLPSER
jgi:hypothetical protein